MKYLYVSSLVALILILSGCSATLTERYDHSYQFAKNGEYCDAVSQVIYKDYQNNYNLLATYQCCSDNSCFRFVLFQDNPILTTKNQFYDGIHVHSLRLRIQNGEYQIPPFTPTSKSVCDFFGSSILVDQSVSVGAEAIEFSNNFVTSEKLADVTSLVKLAKTAKIIKAVNPIDLAGSVTCLIENNEIKEAVEYTESCKVELKNVANGYLEEGGLYRIRNCLKESDVKLQAVINSPLQLTKSLFDKVYSFVANLFTRERDFFDIGKTQYDVVKEIHLSVEGKYQNVLDSKASLEFKKFQQRYDEKLFELEAQKSISKKRLDLIDSNQTFSKQIKEIFLKETDLEIEFSQSLAKTYNKLSECRNYENIYYLNSAILCYSELDTLVKQTYQLMNEANLEKRQLNYVSIFLVISIILIIFIIVKLLIFRTNDEYWY
jgi:hypothetical protein